MKVSELIEALKGMDQDLVVLVASDPEGNEHRELDGITRQAWDLESGEIGLTPDQLDEKAIRQGYSEEDVIDDGVECVCLWP